MNWIGRIGRGRFALAVALLGVPAGLAAQTPYLVANLNTSAAWANPLWTPLVGWHGQVLLQGTDETSGTELWATDGTPAGTRLVADFCPGDCSSSPVVLGEVQGALLGVTASTVAPFAQLWRFDGTPQGTYLLTSVAAHGVSLNFDATLLGNYAVTGDYLYFTTTTSLDDPGLKDELWRSDGTDAGTVPLDDLGPILQQIDIGPLDLTALGKRFCFLTQNYDNNSNTLWVSDGTAAGTKALHNFGSLGLGALTPLGGSLLLTVFDQGAQSAEIWITDGTVAGTHRVATFPNGATALAGLVPSGGDVFFQIDDGQHGTQLWATDGTAAGTRQISSFPSGAIFAAFSFNNPTQGAPAQIVELGGNVVFIANEGGGLNQPWSAPLAPGKNGPSQTTLCVAGCVTIEEGFVKVGNRAVFALGQGLASTDGTSAGTTGLPLACRSGSCSVLSRLATLASAAYFLAGPPSGESAELWRSDGTAAGTRRVAVSGPVGSPSTAPTLAALGKSVVYAPNVSPGELWISDGTAAGTRELAGAGELDGGSEPDNFLAVGGLLVFTAEQTGTSPREQLWTSQGTAASTTLLADPFFLDVLGTSGSAAYFSTNLQVPVDGNGPRFELWKWDPTLPALALAAVLPDAYTAAQVAGATGFLGDLYFAFNLQPPTAVDQVVWKSDGTAAGTAVAFTLPPGYLSPQSLTALGTDLYLVASGPLRGNEVLRSDGTTAGTVALTQFGNTTSPCPPQFTRVGAAVFFVGWDAASGLELWKTDGTPGGTALVADLAPGTLNGNPTELTQFKGALYFFALDGNFHKGLWRSDGTAQGTVELMVLPQVAPGSECDGDPNSLTSTGQLLFFVADDGAHGSELWQSDGTAAGTTLAKDLFPGPVGGNPSGLTAAGGRVYFSADDGEHGFELWQSDGTDAGTHMVADLFPGADSSYPDHLAVVGNRLLFTADDGATGRELWALPLGSGGCAASATVLCLQGNRFAVTIDWLAAPGQAGSGQAVPLTSDTGYFWFFDAGNVEVIVKVLDGRAVDGAFWVFYGALSDVAYAVTVTDTMTGLSRRYQNLAGTLASVADTAAFGAAPDAAPGAGPVRAASPTAGTTTARAAASTRAAAPRRRSRSSTPLEAPFGAGNPAAGAPATCAGDGTHLCLNGTGRFRVEASWSDTAGQSGAGQAVPLTSDTGYFWFFDSTNVEVVLKVLDGTAVNGKFWVFYGALSDVAYTLRVTDTVTGNVKTYTNQSGTLASVADTGAF
jgi:ELWxxDGT repeat protein